MNAETDTMDVMLMGREFRVACAPDDRDALLAAVQIVDAKMRDIAQQTQANGEKLAVMAALNIAHELIQTRHTTAVDLPELKRRMKSMSQRMDDALASQEQLF